MARNRRIRTALYGDVQMEPFELDLIHTPSFQRLYDLHQLGTTDRVYLDASHSRLQHVIGVVWHATRLVDAIIENLRNDETRDTLHYGPDGATTMKSPKEIAWEVADRRRIVRLMGLLHDLTHAPYGHTLEDQIRLVKRAHDDPSEQATAFYVLVCEYIIWSALDNGLEVPGTLKRWLLDSSAASTPELPLIAKLGHSLLDDDLIAHRHLGLPAGEELKASLSELLVAMNALLHLQLLHKRSPQPQHFPEEEYDFQRLLRAVGITARQESHQFNPHRDAYLLDIIGNTICADLLDYAQRDAHHTGLRIDYDDERIVDNFTLVSSFHQSPETTRPPQRQSPFLGHNLRTAVAVFSHKLRIDVPGQLMDLLRARFHVYERALNHPTKCTADAMLGTALQLVGWQQIPPYLGTVGDQVFLDRIRETTATAIQLLAPHDQTKSIKELPLVETERGKHGVVAKLLQALFVSRQDSLAKNVSRDLEAALSLLGRLMARRYYRTAFRLLPAANNVEATPITTGETTAVLAAAFLNERQRFDAERGIEASCSLPRGSTVIHCPSYNGPRKLAEILLYSPSENPRRLNEIGLLLDGVFEEHQKAIRSLEAMYRSMWRLTVCIEPSYAPQFQEMSERISDFLARFLVQHKVFAQSPAPEIGNDPMMLHELNLAAQANGTTHRRVAWKERALLDGLRKRSQVIDEWLTDELGMRADCGHEVDSILDPLLKGGAEYDASRDDLSADDR